MALTLEWFHGLSPDQKEEAKKSLMNSKVSFSLLADFLERELQRLDAWMLSKDSYDSPNWANQQADIIGGKRAITKLLKMIDPIINP